MLKKTLPLAVVAALGLAPALQVAHAQAGGAVESSGSLSQQGASSVAAVLGMSLSEAIAQGMIAPAGPGTYAVTRKGAKAVLAAKGVGTGATGGSMIAGLGPAELTAMVVGVLGLGWAIAEEDDLELGGPAPTTTPTAPPTPSPSPSDAPPTTGSSSSGSASNTGTTGSGT